MIERLGRTRQTAATMADAGHSASLTTKIDGRNHGGYLRSRVQKRSIVVGRHKTSVSLEDVFWNELRAIAQSLGLHLSQLVARIDLERQHGNLSSAIRLFVFEQRCKNAQPDGPTKVGPDESPPARRQD
ncbi:MAG: ribbon-helix-helix domain-containing protein [Pseudolabrys sp.]